MPHLTLARLILGFSIAWANAAALAQNFPNKPLRWIVPYPPGGGSDIGVEPLSGTPEQMANYIKTETARWHALIRERRIALD